MPNFGRFFNNHLIDYINELLLIFKNVFYLTNGDQNGDGRNA